MMADRVAVVQGGRVVEPGMAEAVLASPAQVYTTQLLAAMPRLVCYGLGETAKPSGAVPC